MQKWPINHKNYCWGSFKYHMMPREGGRGFEPNRQNTVIKGGGGLTKTSYDIKMMDNESVQRQTTSVNKQN